MSMAVQAVGAFLQTSHVRTVFFYCVHDRFLGSSIGDPSREKANVSAPLGGFRHGVSGQELEETSRTWDTRLMIANPKRTWFSWEVRNPHQ